MRWRRSLGFSRSWRRGNRRRPSSTRPFPPGIGTGFARLKYSEQSCGPFRQVANNSPSLSREARIRALRVGVQNARGLWGSVAGCTGYSFATRARIWMQFSNCRMFSEYQRSKVHWQCPGYKDAMKTMQRLILTGLLALATILSGCVVHEHGHHRHHGGHHGGHHHGPGCGHQFQGGVWITVP